MLSVFNVIRFHYSTTGLISLPEPADMRLTCFKVEFCPNFTPGDVRTNVRGNMLKEFTSFQKKLS